MRAELQPLPQQLEGKTPLLRAWVHSSAPRSIGVVHLLFPWDTEVLLLTHGFDFLFIGIVGDGPWLVSDDLCWRDSRGAGVGRGSSLAEGSDASEGVQALIAGAESSFEKDDTKTRRVATSEAAACRPTWTAQQAYAHAAWLAGRVDRPSWLHRRGALCRQPVGRQNNANAKTN